MSGSDIFCCPQNDRAKGSKRFEAASLLRRWAPRKKSPRKAVSEPVKPIVFFLHRIGYSGGRREVGYRRWWRKHWQPRLEAAGFKNASMAREAPALRLTGLESTCDRALSVLIGNASPIENASVARIHDSGRARNSDGWNSDSPEHPQNVRIRSMSLSVVVDPRGRKCPLPDDLMGQAAGQYVVGMRWGHTLVCKHT